MGSCDCCQLLFALVEGTGYEGIFILEFFGRTARISGFRSPASPGSKGALYVRWLFHVTTLFARCLYVKSIRIVEKCTLLLGTHIKVGGYFRLRLSFYYVKSSSIRRRSYGYLAGVLSTALSFTCSAVERGANNPKTSALLRGQCNCCFIPGTWYTVVISFVLVVAFVFVN